jgi:hypothetical protein
MLPYGRQPLTIQPEADDTAPTPSVASPNPRPPTPVVALPVAAVIPQDGATSAEEAHVAAPLIGNPPKRTKSLTFEIKENGEDSDEDDIVVEGDDELVPLDPASNPPPAAQPTEIVTDEEVTLDEIV